MQKLNLKISQLVLSFLLTILTMSAKEDVLLNHFESGKTAQRDQKYSAALTEYLVCWDADGKGYHNYEALRRGRVGRKLHSLLQVYPDGKTEISQRQVKLRIKIIESNGSWRKDDILNFIVLCEILDDQAPILEILTHIKDTNAKRYYATKIIAALSENKQYDTIIQWCDDPTPYLVASNKLATMTRSASSDLSQPATAKTAPTSAQTGPRSRAYVSYYLSALTNFPGADARLQKLNSAVEIAEQLNVLE